MAKKNATPEANGTETGTVENAAQEPKQKKERIFGASQNFTEIRKREQKLSWKYERLGRGVKKLELDQDSETKIMDVLKEAYNKEVKQLFDTPAAAPAAEEAFA